MPTSARNLAKAIIVFILLSVATLAQASQYANLNGAQPSTVSQQPSSSQGSYFDHVLVIMLENEGISDICGGNPPPCNGANTPYLSSLANSNGISQQYLSLIGTSQPNYVGILGGSIFTCTRTFGTCPAPGTIQSPNLVDRIEAAGLTWKGYMESQNVAAGCDTANQSPYEYTHNGFVEFQDITNTTARCNKIVLANPAPTSTCTVSDCTLIKDLNSTSAPNFMWLTPNDCDNLHGASVCTNGCASAGSTCMAAGDKYLKTLVTNILDSYTFQKQKSALFITFDEGAGYCPLNNTSEDCLYAVWAGPAAKTSFVSSHLYNMYSLTKTIEANWNLTSLTSNDANANPMTEFLNKTATTPPPPPGAYFDHVVVIMMEDHGMAEICFASPPPCSNSTGASYMAGLANSFAIGAQYLGVSHFSQADYLAMLGGSTDSCSAAGCPWPFSVSNLVDRFDAAHLTWKGYIENQNLPKGCDTVYHQPYTPEHNPFVGFADIVGNATRCNNIVLANPSGCSATDCPLINDLNSGSAPNFMWLTPNNCDNMHGYTYPNGTVLCPASVPMGDDYLKSLVPNILNSPTFTTQRSALFVVFDEGNGYCPLNQSTTEDCVYAVMAGPVAKQHFGTNNLYNHYSFLKTIETNWNLTSLTSNDANAFPMTEFFKPPDFSISTNPSSTHLALGGTGTASVKVTSIDGFTKPVSLSATVSPSTGMVCSLSPMNLTGSGTSSLSCKPSSVGSFNVTVTGVSGSLSHSASVSYTVVVQPSAVIVTSDGRVYNYYQNGTDTLVGRPVGSQLRQVAWKPDGSYALIVGDQGVILTFNGKLLTRFSSPIVGNANLDAVAWKPDGSYALIAGQNGLIFKFNGTALAKITDTSNRNIDSISWNPDGNSAFLVGDAGTALLYKTTGQVTLLATGTGQQLFAVAWNPNGTYALAAGGNGVVLKYNGTKFAVLTQGGGPAGHNIRFIAFNPTGGLAILVGDGGQILTYNGTKLVLLTNVTNQNLFSVSWSGSVAYIVGQNGVLISYSGGTLKILTSGTNANFLSIAWKPT